MNRILHSLKLLLVAQYISLNSNTLTDAFVVHYGSSTVPFTSVIKRSSQLYAEGAPQYEKRDGVLRESEKLAEGSYMLHIEEANRSPGDNSNIDYEPGHVLALEIEDNGEVKANDKNSQDANENGGWMRGPYTVSRSSASSFSILIKVVGDKSKRLAEAEPGTPLKFGGKFHVPIYEGISKEDTKRVVLISTGVGVGPCVGAIEKMLADDDFTAKVDLIASYRNGSEVVYGDYLNTLAAKHADQFQWKVFITSAMGRVSDSDDNIELATSTNNDICGATQTHYHLIGNAQLVNEFKTGLLRAGVLKGKITTESYFNHKVESREEAIERIATAISKVAMNV